MPQKPKATKPKSTDDQAAAAPEKSKKSMADLRDTPEERRRTRTEIAYLEIADRLADLRFPPGFRFTEAEVAADLNMSKTPVREALLMHVIQGLVMPRPGAGYVVVPITLRDVRGIFRHWRRLAAEAVTLAAKTGLDSQTAVHLSQTIENLAPIEAHATVFYDFFMLTDDRFLIRDYSILTIEIQRVLHLVLDADDTKVSAALEPIVSALASNAAEQARTLVTEHIDELEEAVLDELLSGTLLQGTNLAAPLN